jgi:S-DNA-T family DNA segregation ATPase FtsK/SpoIIIE
LIIDEFADLIMTAGREIESPIGRLAQLARAIGIHLIISTQRPSTNIITGFIKANFPTRIAFRVFSSVDSRTILDATGADRLVGRGDMLLSSGAEPVRVQCAFIDAIEIEELTDYIGSQQGYPDAFPLPEYIDDSEGGVLDVDLRKRDPMFDDAARLVVQHQQGSTSLIQRKLSIGYNRAGRIIDQLEAAGIVGPFEGSKARDVICSDFSHLEQILKGLE